jgi:hypothetical protein
MTRKNPSKTLITFDFEGERMPLSDFLGKALPIHENGFIYQDSNVDDGVILYLDGTIAYVRVNGSIDNPYPLNVRNPNNLRIITFYGEKTRLIRTCHEGFMKIVASNYYCEYYDEEETLGEIYEDDKYNFKEIFYDSAIDIRNRCM